jgi:cell fate (sporulation/competence/biofilm development) regulator YlbF (YheA/YmcA/DUF963 family)
MCETLNFPPELYEATDGLIQNLLASEPFLAYHQSQVRLDSDPQARALLERLSALQSGLRRKQTNGGVTQAEIEELRAVQDQVQANATILAYAQSQQEAVNFLREINQEISQLLGVNFASLARATTC